MQTVSDRQARPTITGVRRQSPRAGIRLVVGFGIQIAGGSILVAQLFG